MMADAEFIKIIDQIFTKLDPGPFQIKISNRKLLDTMIQIAEIPKTQLRQFVQKLDKNQLRKKGVIEEQADILSKIVQQRGEAFQLIQQLKEQKMFEQLGKEALDYMELLFNLLKYMDGLKMQSLTPYAIVIGGDEVKQEIVKFKDLIEQKEETVNLKDLVQIIKQKVGK